LETEITRTEALPRSEDKGLAPQPRGRSKMAEGKVVRRGSKQEKLGVKIVLEITGHMQRGEVDQFMASLSSVVNNHLENGGNGG
jgi:hypothetical protein